MIGSMFAGYRKGARRSRVVQGAVLYKGLCGMGSHVVCHGASQGPSLRPLFPGFPSAVRTKSWVPEGIEGGSLCPLQGFAGSEFIHR